MITITINRDNLKHIIGYNIVGHAGHDQYGRDIVCAAVSVLAQATVFGLIEEAKINASYSIDEKKGVLKCWLPVLDACDRRKADLLLNTMFKSLEILQKEYPNNIVIID